MQHGAAPQGDVRKETRHIFPLPPNPRIEVLNINHDVIIQTHDSVLAEVVVIRRAKRQRDLTYHLVRTDPTPAGLMIEGKEDRKAYGRGIVVEQHVTLRVPRQVSLELRGIGGSVWIGELNGPLKLEQVSGSLEIHVAKDLSFELTAKNIGGDLCVNLPNVERVDPDSGAVSMTMRIGAGGTPILINQVGGSVFIR